MKSGGKNIPGNIQILYDPAIPFLKIYPTEMCTYMHQKTCTRMFLIVSFITERIRNVNRILEYSYNGIPHNNENYCHLLRHG